MTRRLTGAGEGLPIVVDVEASGFGRGSYPVEVGLALADATPHCFLVAPERGWHHWDPEAEALHGISREVLEAHGRPVQEVAWRLNALIAGRTVYSDAWGQDLSWLARLFEAARMVQGFRVAALRELLEESQLERWEPIRRQVEREMDLRRHRASGDARILQETYRRLQTPRAA